MKEKNTINYKDVYQRIMELLFTQNKSFSELKDKGVNPQVLTRLSDGSATSADKLYQIAKFLDTTCEFLLTGEDPNNNIQTESEELFMHFFRHLPSDYKLPVKLMTQQLYEIAKVTDRLVDNELDEILKHLDRLNPEVGKELFSMSQEERIDYVNEIRKKNEDFEEYLRLNFTQITDRRKKDLAVLEIDRILEKYRDFRIENNN